MEDYKGIYYGEEKEQKSFEGGAHFRYKDLYNILKILGGEINENDENKNSDLLDIKTIFNANFNNNEYNYSNNNDNINFNNNPLTNIEKSHSRNLNKFNYLNNPNTKVSSNSILTNLKNENKNLLFHKLSFKESSSNSLNKYNKAISNMKFRSFKYERISKSLGKNESINKKLLLNHSNKVKNLKLNNNLIVSSGNLNKNFPKNNNNSLHMIYKNNLINNISINNYLNTIYHNKNYFDNYSNNNNQQKITFKRSRNNFNQSHIGYIKSIDLNNKNILGYARSSEKINFNQTINPYHKLEKTKTEKFNFMKKKSNDLFLIMPKKDLNNNKKNINLGFTLFHNVQKNLKKN